MPETDNQEKHAASKQFHAVIDRIEDGVAVLMAGDDEKEKIDIPASLLPADASDGDHLRITIALDKDSRAAAADRIKKLQDKLIERSGTQDQKDFKL